MGDQGLMLSMPTPHTQPGLLGFGVCFPTLDRSQWWSFTGHRLGLKLTPWKGSKAGYNQKHMDTETSIPKSGPKKLNLPHQVCVGGGEGVDNQTDVL